MLGNGQGPDEDVVLLDVAGQRSDRLGVPHLDAVHSQLALDRQTTDVALVQNVKQRRFSRTTASQSTHRILRPGG